MVKLINKFIEKRIWPLELKRRQTSIRKKMDNNVEFTTHVSIDHRSSSAASVCCLHANLNLSQCYNLKLRQYIAVRILNYQ